MSCEPWYVQRRRELEAAAPVKRKTKKWQRRFVSVPWVWANQLKTCDRAATFKLALLLLYEHWRSNGSWVRLTNALAATMDILPEAKRRALADLERRGLVSVERGSRETPVVTVLHVSLFYSSLLSSLHFLCSQLCIDRPKAHKAQQADKNQGDDIYDHACR